MGSVQNLQNEVTIISELNCSLHEPRKSMRAKTLSVRGGHTSASDEVTFTTQYMCKHVVQEISQFYVIQADELNCRVSFIS